MKEFVMEHTLPDLYVIDSSGNEQKVKFSKLRLEFQNGNQVTVEINEHNPDNTQEIAIRGYYGDEECGPGEKFIVLNIRPASSNIIYIKPESHTIKGSCS